MVELSEQGLSSHMSVKAVLVKVGAAQAPRVPLRDQPSSIRFLQKERRGRGGA